MAIPRVDISQEIADWQAAVYGEEVRSANVSALTKLQTQMNAACDGIEDAETDVATAVNTANAASTTANQASSAAQTAIATANAAITTAQGYAANAEGSAQNAAASATAAQTAQTGAQTAQLAAEAAEQAAEDAAQQAQISIHITPDEETIHHADDVVGTISTITYTLEEIAAMTDASGKVPDASAVKSLRDALTTLQTIKLVNVIPASSVITKIAGDAYGFYISDARMIVFMTIAIRTTANRNANQAAFSLQCNSKELKIIEPYNLPSVASDGVMRYSTYTDGGNGIRYISPPVALTANTDWRVSGVFFADVVS